MTQQELLKSYAKLIVKKGVNVQKGQPVVINGSIEARDFCLMVSEEAYKAGASVVEVRYLDAKLNRLGYKYQTEENLKIVPEWTFDRNLFMQEHGACYISLLSPDFDAMKGIDPKKLDIAAKASRANPKMAKIMEYTMANKGQWCVCAYPNANWAKKVFPKLSLAQANKELMKAILLTSRVSGGKGALANWNEHNKNMAKRCEILNKYNFKALQYKNKLGTNFTVELIKNHIWAAGGEYTQKKVFFNPNIPTEEVFTAPNKYGANGKVVATKPLFYNGKLIEDFYLVFKNGKVVSYGAKKEKEVLKSIIETDVGSHYLGEVALVPYNSPISQSGILFYNTLFDENASCHLALGMAYPSCVKDGFKLQSKEQKDKAGLNASLNHVDFMIGSKDMEIIGITFDGKKIPVFKNGNFVF